MFKKSHLPLILQSEMAECGLASLSMILQYHGFPISLTELRQRYPAHSRGLTLLQIKKIAEANHMHAQVIRCEVDELSNITLPCIIHWQYDHFLVLRQLTKQGLVVHDPARGVHVIPREEVFQHFTGIALELQPKGQWVGVKPSSFSMMRFLLPIIKQYRFIWLGLVLISLCLQGLLMLSVSMVQAVIDHASQGIDSILLALLSVKIMQISIVAIRGLFATRLGALLNDEMGATVMRHFLALPPLFFDSRYIGDVLTRFGAIERMRTFLVEGFVEGVLDVVLSLAFIIKLALESKWIGLLVVISSLLFASSQLLHRQTFRRYENLYFHERSKQLSHFMETIRSIVAIKLFSRQVDRLTKWRKHFSAELNASTQLAFTKIKTDFTRQAIIEIEFIVLLTVGCLLISRHQLSLGVLYAMLIYRQHITATMARFADKLHDYRSLTLNLERLGEVMVVPSEFAAYPACHQCVSAAAGKLTLEHVSFSYDLADEPVIHDFNIVVSPGECVVLTGASGCGKSTLFKIMMGLLPPSAGRVLFNAHSVYPQHVACYRQNIAAVLQEDRLLAGTLLENITFFDTEIDMEHVVSCARLAGIWDEIAALPMRLYTRIGEIGHAFSGGQQQRILLARALYARPKILFLDEASSHLDSKKEREVNRSIRSLGITVIMIAHRLETIQMADRVIELGVSY